ncbi:MAG: hypothetical protein R3D62_02860 [Xanthobacteraceae bacterium]
MRRTRELQRAKAPCSEPLWQLNEGRLVLLANLSAEQVALTGAFSGQPLWGGPVAEHLAPWAVHWAWDAR